MALCEDSEVYRAYCTIKEKYPELWNRLVAVEIDVFEQNRDVWDFDLKSTLESEGFIYNGSGVYIFIAAIRELVDVQFVPFLVPQEFVPKLRSRLALKVPYDELDVEFAVNILKSKHLLLWRTLKKNERYRPRALIWQSICSSWFQVISIVKSEGLDYGVEFNGLFAQDIRERL